MLSRAIKRALPFILIAATNLVLDFLFPKAQKIIYAPYDVLFLAAISYVITYYQRNKYNILISRFWIVFFFLGIMNMNSVILYDKTWDVDIRGASLLYFLNIIIFNASLLFFERRGDFVPKRLTVNSYSFLKNRILVVIMLIFPFLLIITLYKSVGFLPILSGASFVDEMYNYNYGPLYGYKFICVYGFLMTICYIKLKKYRSINLALAIVILLITSVDGKRFILFICLLAYLPLNDYLNRITKPGTKTSYTPLIIVSSVILLVYVSVLAIRLGNNNVNEWIGLFIEKIPFGVEFKDYAYSFEKFNATTIQDYDFWQSNIGAFFNSGLLNFLGYDKEALTHMGSAYVWMKAYNIDFGIRTGIISELYFAHGIFGSAFMVLLAYFVNRTSVRLIRPTSIFNLIQHCILYALYILIINGQATVFFGCLSMMLYVYLLKWIIEPNRNKKRNGFYHNTRIQPS
ncbi:hypothetical protein C7T94_01150 [Pedobacter yulinensis]|uniref:Oligosaccharide repeat unit polymerase n=1 Tax=Pedobacter yulinensis TaxID=2126353 RepID=A0A2T3HQT7_9SPHI|nr:hypothetical protein C7T94_01150 [Pedobacter yulinensis]